MESQGSVLVEEHVEEVGQDSPSEDYPQAHGEAFCSCYSTLALQNSGSHTKDLGKSNLLLLDAHLDYFYSRLHL